MTHIYDKLPPMSETLAFDTHRFVKHLAGNGFTVQQAETMVEGQVRFLNANLATTGDLKTDLAQTKYEIIKWMAGMIVGAVVAMSALIVSLINSL